MCLWSFNSTGDYFTGYDAAILVLKESVNFSGTIKPANLPKAGQDCKAPGSAMKGKVLDTTGWGKEKTNINHGGALWTVKQECLPDKFCESDENQLRTGVLPEIELCIGHSGDLTSGSCQGDSGGMYTNAFKYV